MFIISLIEKLSKVGGIVGMVLVLPLIGALVYEVFSRYVLGAPTAWAFEVSYMLTGSIFMFSLAYALSARLHVNVDFVNAFLSPRLRAAIDLLGYLMFLAATVWLCWALFGATADAYRSGEVSGVSAWNPVVWPFRAVWLLGFILLVLQVAAEIVRALIALWTGRSAEKNA